MDDNPEQKLMGKIKDCQKTARNLLKEHKSLLQKQKSTDTTDDSDHSVKIPLAKYVTKRLKAIDLALESNQQQLKLALEKYLRTLSDLSDSDSEDCSAIQSDDNQMEVAKVTVNQQVKLSRDNNDQNEANLNPLVQALFTGTLPDDFFLHLMSVIGIQECLLSNRLVCSLWNELVLERCNNQKSLKLFENFNCLKKYGELLLDYEKTDDTSLILKSIGDDLLFERFETDHWQLVKSLHQDDDGDDDESDDDEGDDQKEVSTREEKLDPNKVLTTRFPKVEELVICPYYYPRINIKHLLQFYAKQLTSLTMTHFDHSVGKFISCLSFPKLKSLNTFISLPAKNHLLSLLPQLESLTLSSTMISLETLLRTGTHLRELNIAKFSSVYTEPEEDFSKRPPINSQLRKFTFCSTKNESKVLEFISRSLTSLECLKLSFNGYRGNLHSVTSSLVPLAQLHSLTLEPRLSFFHLDDTKLAQIQPLPSVRHLKLILWDYTSLSLDRFSKSLFAAFPNVEQVLIAFIDDSGVDTDTLAAFEAFASKHPNVVQLFRSKYLSKFTAFPNIVAPLLGHRRQVYEEYIAERELFGAAICKLTACLVRRQGDNRPNLKSALRPADPLAAMSNLFQLLERKAFALDYDRVRDMMERMVDCALKYDASQVALFMVTCKCVLALLGYRVVDGRHPDEWKEPFLEYPYCPVSSFVEMVFNLVEHYTTLQLDEKDFLLHLCKRMVKLLRKYDSVLHVKDNGYHLDEYEMFQILLKLADYYKTEQLTVLDHDEELLFQIRDLMDDQLEGFDDDRFDELISESIYSENPVYQVEMVRALLRNCESTDNRFKLLSGEGDSDSSEGESSDGDSSDGESSDSDSGEADSSDSITSDGSSSSAENEPEL